MGQTQFFQIGYKYQDRYEILQVIKSQGNSKKFSVMDIQQKKKKIINRIQITAEVKGKVSQEIPKLKQMEHPNIIEVFDCSIATTPESKIYFCLILQSFEGNQIYNYLSKFSDKQIFEIYQQIKSAIQYIHKKDLLHRDISLHNVFIDKNKNIKLTHCKIQSKNEATGLKYYEPPQFLQSKIIGKYTDFWQFGILFLQIAARTTIQKILSSDNSVTSIQKNEQVIQNKQNSIPKELNQKILDETIKKFKINKLFEKALRSMLKINYQQRKLQEIQFYQQVIQASPSTFNPKHLVKEIIEPSLSFTRITNVELSSKIQVYHILNLTQLYCPNSFLIDESAKIIKSLTNLKILDISGNNLSDKFTEQICTLNLLQINLAFTYITDASVPHILKFKNLSCLDVSYTKISSQGILKTLELVKLQYLAAWSGEFYPDKYHKHIQQNIDINFCKYEENKIYIDLETVKKIELSKLKSIMINLQKISQNQLINKMQQGSSQVQVIGNINNKSTIKIKQMKNLSKMFFYTIRSEEIPILTSHQLVSISIIDCKINMQQFIQSLANYKNLNYFNFSHNRMSITQACSIISKINHVSTLNLSNNKISREEAKILHDNATLQLLSLQQIYKKSEQKTKVERHLKENRFFYFLNQTYYGVGKQIQSQIQDHIKQLDKINSKYQKTINEAIKILKKMINYLTKQIALYNFHGNAKVKYIASTIKRLTEIQFSAKNQNTYLLKEIIKDLKKYNLEISQKDSKYKIFTPERLVQIQEDTNLLSLQLQYDTFDKKRTKDISTNIIKLIQLNIKYNDIGKNIAVSLKSLATRLISLNLSSFNIGDTGVKQLASHLKKLEYLDLESNRIQAQGAISIANNLKDLKKLNLKYNNIRKNGAIEIAKNLKKLMNLNLFANNIEDEGAIYIATNLKNLTVLDLTSNQITQQGGMPIGKYLINLRILNLSFNDIKEQTFREISLNLKYLTVLKLTNCKLGRYFIVQISENIKKNLKNLYSLNLSYNQIQSIGMIQLSKNLSNLSILKLSQNNIGNQGIAQLSKNMKKLKTLSLQSNRITKEGITHITTNMKTLKKLDLAANPIYDDGAIDIAKNLNNLISLNLAWCSITQLGVNEIVNMKNLKNLLLKHNGIDNLGAIQIGKKMKNLIRLDLSHNNNIDNETITKIRKQLPNTYVSFKNS